MFGNFQKRVDNWFGRLKINAGKGTQAALTVNQGASSTANLLEMQSGGITLASMTNTGNLKLPPGSASELAIKFGGYLTGMYGTQYTTTFISNGSTVGRFGSSGLDLMADNTIIAFGAGSDLALYRDAAQTLGLRLNTSPCTFNIYSTYTSTTSYHRMALTCAKQTLSAVSGATVATTGGLIPAGAFLMGVTTRVNTALGTSNGTTGYSVGNGTDANLWGDVTAVAAGTASKASAIASQSSGYTASDACGLYLAAQDVTLTATGGNFDATGAIEISAFYFLAEAD